MGFSLDSDLARHRERLVRAAVLMGCAVWDAEDAVQTTLAQAYRHRERVETAQQPTAYLMAMLLNQIRASRRRRWWSEVPHADPPTTPEPWSTDLAVGLSVRTALDRLSMDHRRIVVLRYYLDVSERDAAAALGISVGTAKSRLARALGQLAKDPAMTALSQSEGAHHD